MCSEAGSRPRRATILPPLTLGIAVMLLAWPTSGGARSRRAARPRPAAPAPAARPLTAEEQEVKSSFGEPFLDRLRQAGIAAGTYLHANRLGVAGLRSLRKSEFADAMYLLGKAYALVPSPNLRVYMAEAYTRLGSFLKAKAHLDGFLAESQAWTLTPIRPAMVAQARALLADLLPRLVALRVHVNVVGADLFVNGEPVGRSPLRDAVWLMPGTSTLVALHPGRVKLEVAIVAPRPGVQVERRIELLTPEEGIRRHRLFQEAERRNQEAERHRLEAERRQRVVAAQLAQARRVEALRVARRQARLRIAGYVLAGVGVACAAIAGGLWREALDEAASVRSSVEGTRWKDSASAYGRARQLETSTNALIGAGATVATTGVILALVGLLRQGRTELLRGPGSRSPVSVSPVLDGRRIGLVLGGRF